MKAAFYAAFERWRMLPPRQRWILLAGVALLLIGFFIAYVWLPLMQNKARLEQLLPQLEANLVALERDAAEVKRLTAQPVADTAQTRRALDVATARNVFGPAATITALDRGTLRIVTHDRTYAVWLDQLENLLTATQAAVISFSIKKNRETQSVSTEVMLSASKP